MSILRWGKHRRYSPFENLFDGILNRNVGNLTGTGVPAQFFRGVSYVNRVFEKASAVSRVFTGISRVERTIQLED